MYLRLFTILFLAFILIVLEFIPKTKVDKINNHITIVKNNINKQLNKVDDNIKRFNFDNSITENIVIPLKEENKDFFTNIFGMKFIYIPKGTSIIGSQENEAERSNDETAFQVTFTKGFYLQTTEVTQGQWKAVVKDNPSTFKECGDNCPVESVSWNDIQSFINKLNQFGSKEKYRLPTEIEWEYACKLGYHYDFFNKNTLEEYAWFENNSPNKLHPVGIKKPSAIGLYDMLGNVWEWCDTIYGKYPSGSVVDPIRSVDNSGLARVDRGGSFKYGIKYLRPSFRGHNLPNMKRPDLGFRLVKISND